MFTHTHTHAHTHTNAHTHIHTHAGPEWLEVAGAAVSRGLTSADGHDLATLLAACNT